MATTDNLRITEIFYSLQGESSRSGLATVFVRLSACPLRCSYCDSAYAFSGGQVLSIEAILAEVERFSIPYVCVTGGEPLAQKNCLALLCQLADKDYQVSLETSGALPIEFVDPRIKRIVDIKTPASGEMEKVCWRNLAHIRPQDELKFVLSDRADYDWACATIEQHQLASRCHILFSPVWGVLDPTALATWILEDHLTVRLQLQLHKLLWGDRPGV